MKIKRSIVSVILGVVIAGSVAFAVGREPDGERRANRSSKETVQRGSVQPASGSTSTASETRAGQAGLTAVPPTQLPLAATLSPKGPLAGEQIKWQVISGGGDRSVSGNLVMSGTIGQTAVGEIASTDNKTNQGFWQNWLTGCCVGSTGNTDGSGDDVVDISDVFAMVDYLGASIPLSSCPEENDDNIDGTIDISDLFSLIDFLSGAAGLPACP